MARRSLSRRQVRSSPTSASWSSPPDGRFITQLIKTKDNPYESAKITAITNDIHGKVKAVTSEVVDHSDYTLVSDENDQWIVRGEETNAGDLVADAYRHAMKADIGLENGGGIGNDIHAGDITYGDITANCFPSPDRWRRRHRGTSQGRQRDVQPNLLPCRLAYQVLGGLNSLFRLTVLCLWHSQD